MAMQVTISVFQFNFMPFFLVNTVLCLLSL